MTQKHVQISAYAVLMILGVSTAWAEAKKEGRELLPAPRCCCDESDCAILSCCAAKEAGSCCAKQTQNVTAKCCKSCDIEHWLQTACPLDITLKIVVDEPLVTEASMFVLGMKGVSFGNLLGTLLHELHLAYVIKDNVLQITTVDLQAGDKTVSKIYPVGNLVSPAEPIILPLAGGDVFFGWSTRTPAGLRLLDDTPEESLMNLIVSAIKPQSWHENGGSGTIDYVPVSKSLVVSQTPDIQEQVGDFLAALGRLQQQESACAPAPFHNMPMPMPAPAFPSPAPPVAIAAPMPPFFAYPVPPAVSFARVPPPAAVGAMPPPERHPAPAAAPTSRTYALEAVTIRRSADGKKEPVACPRMVFCPEPCFRGQIAIAYKEGEQYRNWVLQVKATALKNERLHLEVIGVQAKAENSDNGEIALGLDVKPLLDRKVKLGKTVKKVLEKDETGAPCKWVELTVREVQQSPVGAVWPPAVEGTTTAFMPAVSCPFESIGTAVAAFHPAYSAIGQAATTYQSEVNQPWRIRSVPLEGKTRLIMRQGDQDSVTVNTLEIRIPGNDCLKVSPAGEQVCAQNASVEAQADAVSSTGQSGCFLFEGHVSLFRKKDGGSEHVVAERVLINLADGQLEFQAGN
jgi:hypothetical protein